MATVALTEHVRESVERERQVVAERLAGLQEQARRMRQVADALDGAVADTARLLRNIDEMLGLAPQLSLDAMHGELRGQKLQEIAVELLKQRRGAGAVVHYREWFDLLTEAGIRVAGRDPLASFLTQIGRASGVGRHPSRRRLTEAGAVVGRSQSRSLRSPAGRPPGPFGASSARRRYAGASRFAAACDESPDV